MNLVKEYLGKVSPTTEGRWDLNKAYTRLSIVYTKQSVTIEDVDYDVINSYISRKSVPKNTLITNTEYWQPLGISRTIIAADLRIEPYIVTITNVDDDTHQITSMSADKDYADALAAFKDGIPVLFNYDGDMFSVQYANNYLMQAFCDDKYNRLTFTYENKVSISNFTADNSNDGLMAASDYEHLWEELTPYISVVDMDMNVRSLRFGDDFEILPDHDTGIMDINLETVTETDVIYEDDPEEENTIRGGHFTSEGDVAFVYNGNSHNIKLMYTIKGATSESLGGVMVQEDIELSDMPNYVGNFAQYGNGQLYQKKANGENAGPVKNSEYGFRVSNGEPNLSLTCEFQTLIDGNSNIIGGKVKMSDPDSTNEVFNFTIPLAGNGDAGLMSPADKENLDNLVSALPQVFDNVNIETPHYYADNAQYEIKNGDDVIVTLQLDYATQIDAGLMSATDKAKLDGISYYGDAFMFFKVTSFNNVSNQLTVADAENPYVYNPNNYTPAELLSRSASGIGAMKAVVDFTALGVTADFPNTFLRIWEGYLVFDGINEFRLYAKDGYIRFEYSNNQWILLLYLE